MRLRHLEIEKSSAGGGAFDGVFIDFGRGTTGATNEPLAPLCLIGANGAGKSQILQLLAEIFQAAWHVHAPDEERDSANDEILFDLTYLIGETHESEDEVRLTRTLKGKSAGPIEMFQNEELLEPGSDAFGRCLPTLVVGYTSGENETLSLPFLFSRSGYAEDVRDTALKGDRSKKIPDNRMVLIDYGTNLEVLFASLMLGDKDVRENLLSHSRLGDLKSCRCSVRLAHSAVPKASKAKAAETGRKGIQLTDELEEIIDRLRRVATCWQLDEKSETYTFDFFISEETRKAFASFWDTSFEFYRSLHKLALLNDLAIPKSSRERIKKDVKNRKFASRLAEPQQEEMVFGFEEVRFWHANAQGGSVDYVSLSDGEHQQALILGAYAMITDRNTLFLLDEPESHFNPKWRVKFVRRLLEMTGSRGNQELLLTTHAPFVPSDMRREQVLIFKRPRESGMVEVSAPPIETFGATFDRILETCFDIRPPNSEIAEDKIEVLLKSDDEVAVEAGFRQLGSSTGKALLADHLRKLKKKNN